MAILTATLKPSRYLITLLCLTHAGAMALLWPLALMIEVKGGLAVLIVLSLFYYLRCDALLTAAHAVCAFEFLEDMQCKLMLRNGETLICQLHPGTFVAPYLTVMLLIIPGRLCKTQSVVILPDSLYTDTFRRLRVLLRWKWKAGTPK